MNLHRSSPFVTFIWVIELDSWEMYIQKRLIVNQIVRTYLSKFNLCVNGRPHMPFVHPKASNHELKCTHILNHAYFFYFFRVRKKKMKK